VISVLNGYKTYAVSIGAVLVGVGQFLMGETDLIGLVTYFLAGAGAASLRHALARIKRP